MQQGNEGCKYIYEKSKIPFYKSNLFFITDSTLKKLGGDSTQGLLYYSTSVYV